ncbi:MAG: methylated-DNA--[protein]-cysteine S-methyltransferase [Pseudomonadota bacterium]|nr:methylated-DNA--[protein]-cysteine S-methyltransferase [Pseudomonadota bacterium]
MNKKQNFTAIFKSPVGYLGILIDGKTLAGLEFLGRKKPLAEVAADSNEVTIKAVSVALKHYFNDPCHVGQPGIVLNGTAFQKKIWKALSLIKPGKTRTYGDIARELKTSPRAVGNACRSNPVPIFIPCHRVVSTSGRGGFMGRTSGEPLAIKEWLLVHEQKAAAGK